MVATTDVEQLARKVLSGATTEIHGDRGAESLDEAYVTELYVRIRAELLSAAEGPMNRRKEELTDALVTTVCLVSASHQPGFRMAPELFPRLRKLIARTLA